MNGSLRGPRFLVVTGKGGVGRTTLTAALGMAAAAAGLRTCVVELHGQEALARRLGIPPGYGPVAVGPRLSYRGLTPVQSVGDFGRRKLHLPRVATWFVESRVTRGFLDAVPGLADIVQLGKIENMIREPAAGDPIHDVILLDAPATGHGLSLLAGARAMREMTRVGPFAELASRIEDFLADHDETAFLLATLPSALPVQEARQLADRLAREQAPPRLAVLNQCPPPAPASADTLRAALGALPHPAGPALAAIGVDALDEAARTEQLAAELAHGLAVHAPTPVLRVPRLRNPDDLAPLVAALAPAWKAP